MPNRELLETKIKNTITSNLERMELMVGGTKATSSIRGGESWPHRDQQKVFKALNLLTFSRLARGIVGRKIFKLAMIGMLKLLYLKSSYSLFLPGGISKCCSLLGKMV